MRARQHGPRAYIIVRLHPAGERIQQARRMPKALTAEPKGIDHTAIARRRPELRVRWRAFHEGALHQRRGGAEPTNGEGGDLDADYFAVGAEARDEGAAGFGIAGEEDELAGGHPDV